MDAERPRTLGFAVWSENVALVREMLHEGVDPNAYGSICSGVTPLMESVDELERFYDADRVTVTRLLLESGADATLRDNHGHSVLHYAAGAGAVAIDLLLAEGADVSATDHQGNTPLHEAVQRGCVSAVEALRRAGADAEVENADGRSPRQIFNESRSEFDPVEVSRMDRAFR